MVRRAKLTAITFQIDRKTNHEKLESQTDLRGAKTGARWSTVDRRIAGYHRYLWQDPGLIHEPVSAGRHEDAEHHLRAVLSVLGADYQNEDGQVQPPDRSNDWDVHWKAKIPRVVLDKQKELWEWGRREILGVEERSDSIFGALRQNLAIQELHC